MVTFLRQRSARKILVSLLIAVFTAGSASPVQAGPILDSALRIAAGMPLEKVHSSSQLGNCQETVIAKAERTANDRGVGGYVAGGFFLPIIMPLIADGGATPQAPLATLQGLDSGSAACFNAAYGERLKNRRVGAAWKGSWIGIATTVALAVLVAATMDDVYY